MIDARPAYAQLLFPAPVAGAVALAIAAVVLLPSAARAQPPPAWRWPLPGAPEVVRGFDPPDRPWGAGHRGVDLGAYAGEPVYAAGAGRIGYVGRIAGRGIVTVVHGDRRTTYLPVRASVHVGDRVKAGGRIGAVEPGFAHCPARVCLHWGLIRGETYLDPLSLIPRSPVRLLPFNTPGPNGPGPGFPLLAASAVGGLTRHAPAPRTKPVSELARSALAGTGGAGVVLLVLAASGRATRRRPRRPPEPGEAQRATAMHYHPAGGRRFPPASRSTTSPENPQMPPTSPKQPDENAAKPTRAGDRPLRDSGHAGPNGDQQAPDNGQAGPGNGEETPDEGRRIPGIPLLAAIRPVPGGRHRKAHRLRHLVTRLRGRRTPTSAPAPAEPTYAKIIDLDAERRARRPTTPDEPDHPA